ncbi:unnamed protein product [Calypogeia fissa]
MDSVSHSDDSGSPVQRRNAVTSRRKKSKDQIEILERLYAENKYPSEEVRAKLSQQLGLSEKQMQIWFTHRRHKDRKDGVEDVKLTFYAMRHKGGEAHLDFMEGLNSGKVPGGSLLGSENSGGRQPTYSGGEVNTGQQRMLVDSRRVDSESENSGLGQADDCNGNGFSKPSLKRGSLVNRKDGVYKRPMTVPPSRAKVQAKDLELAVVSAVEAQLGESLRMDGPTLSMEFDALPPGAWANLQQAGAAVPVAPQGKGQISSQGRVPVPAPVQSRAPAPAQGRLSMGVQQGRVGRIQSVGTY